MATIDKQTRALEQRVLELMNEVKSYRKLYSETNKRYQRLLREKDKKGQHNPDTESPDSGVNPQLESEIEHLIQKLENQTDLLAQGVGEFSRKTENLTGSHKEKGERSSVKKQRNCRYQSSTGEENSDCQDQQTTRSYNRPDRRCSESGGMVNDRGVEYGGIIHKQNDIESKSIVFNCSELLVERSSLHNDLEVRIERLEQENRNLQESLAQSSTVHATEKAFTNSDVTAVGPIVPLADVYRELYEKEWKAAFDEQIAVHPGQDFYVIQLLLNIFVKTHHLCHEAARGFISSIWSAAFSFPGDKESGSLQFPQVPDVPQGIYKSLCDVRAMMSPSLKCTIEQDLQKECRERGLHMKTQTQSFVTKCLDLCWDMSVKDPPVVLTSLPETGSVYDTDKYRSYTESGSRVSYVVWPGMILYDQGPVVVKGVVQGV